MSHDSHALLQDFLTINKESGVYFILRTSSEAPSFLTVGTGGHFKGKNPNVTISELECNWIDNTQIIYIGNATSLQKRLKQYMNFGQRSFGRFVKYSYLCAQNYNTNLKKQNNDSTIIDYYSACHESGDGKGTERDA